MALQELNGLRCLSKETPHVVVTKPKRLHTDASHDMYLHIGCNLNLNMLTGGR